MQHKTLGIDISKSTFDAALYDGQSYQMVAFSNDAAGHGRLLSWLVKRDAISCRACMEATGRYGELLAEQLYAAGYQVSVVNPRSIKRYAEAQLSRNKTDREDAKRIAHFAATQQPNLWRPLAPHHRALQEQVRRRQELLSLRQQERNRLASGIRDAVTRADIAASIAFFDERIVRLDRHIAEFVAQHGDLAAKVALLCTIGGIAFITATSILAEVPDITRFDSASHFAAFAGLTPRHYHSGRRSDTAGTLSRIGSRRLRTIFYMPSIVARRYNPVIVRLVERLERAGKSPAVIRGAVMRKMCHLVFGVLKSGKPFDPDYAVKMGFAT